MSPGIGGGRRFVINLKEMSGTMIVAGLMGPPATERFSQRSRGVASDAVALEPDRPSSVEVLADQNAAAGVAAVAGPRGDIED